MFEPPRHTYPFVKPAKKEVKLAVGENKVVNVAFVIEALFPFIVLPAKLPFTVKFEAVVDPRVEEAVTNKLPVVVSPEVLVVVAFVVEA